MVVVLRDHSSCYIPQFTIGHRVYLNQPSMEFFCEGYKRQGLRAMKNVWGYERLWQAYEVIRNLVCFANVRRLSRASFLTSVKTLGGSWTILRDADRLLRPWTTLEDFGRFWKTGNASKRPWKTSTTFKEPEKTPIDLQILGNPVKDYGRL